MEVLQQISAMPVDASGLIADRVEIRKVTIRDTPPEPFINDTAAATWAPIGPCSRPAPARSRSSSFADKAPETVRQFLRMAEAGVYNGMAFHRVAPGFVIQTGALSSRTAPLSPKQQALVHDLQPEFNDTKHVKGIVSMARGESPTSAQTSFFICVGHVDGARRRLHGVRPRRGRHGRGGGDRADAAHRRDAEHPHRPRAPSGSSKPLTRRPMSAAGFVIGSGMTRGVTFTAA